MTIRRMPLAGLLGCMLLGLGASQLAAQTPSESDIGRALRPAPHAASTPQPPARGTASRFPCWRVGLVGLVAADVIDSSTDRQLTLIILRRQKNGVRVVPPPEELPAKSRSGTPR